MRIVQSRLRYIVGGTPRANGYSPGIPISRRQLVGTSAGFSTSGTSRSLQVENLACRGGSFASAWATVVARQRTVALRMTSASPGDSPSDVYSSAAPPSRAAPCSPIRGNVALLRLRRCHFGLLRRSEVGLVVAVDPDARPHEVARRSDDGHANRGIESVHEVLERRVLVEQAKAEAPAHVGQCQAPGEQPEEREGVKRGAVHPRDASGKGEEGGRDRRAPREKGHPFAPFCEPAVGGLTLLFREEGVPAIFQDRRPPALGTDPVRDLRSEVAPQRAA